jgi:predicted protein tyrosine phosphatase
MIEIDVYSKTEFEATAFTDNNIDNLSNNFFICINATGHVHSSPHFVKEHDNVLNCYFDDVEHDQVKFDTVFNIEFNARACTLEQAAEIKNFVDAVPDESKLHIYCSKGKSRSPAVAKFVEEYKNNKTVDYENYNQHVYTILKSLIC